jgi:hypothetical protein
LTIWSKRKVHIKGDVISWVLGTGYLQTETRNMCISDIYIYVDAHNYLQLEMNIHECYGYIYIDTSIHNYNSTI